MFELFQASISQHQILLTLALGLVVIYWLMVIIGVLDLETDAPDAFVDHHGSTDLTHDATTGSIWMSTGRILGFAKVPIVVWASFIILFMWFLSLALNQSWNPAATTSRALILLIPNFFISAIITKIVTIPISKLYAAMAEGDPESEVVLGRTGTITSTEADETYGQVEIPAKGAPLLINVRTLPGSPALTKGTTVTVTAAGPDHVYYYIQSSQPSNP
ncbi:MAG: hypothetical protein EAZ42_01790 [Verrucomicrobia bacterium]|nr:MAG: hypothetical protein EAZ42_01790 [Verrucomicrobiota bacterium]